MASRSPVSAVSQQQKISSTPDKAPTSPQPSSLPAPEATAQAVPFPSPQTFDFLPLLHALILRLLSSSNISTSNAAAAGSQPTIGGNASVGVASQTEAGSQSQQKQSQSQHLKPKTQPIGRASDSATPSSNLPPLEAKDLFTAASAIRIRIQKARAVVEGLPDVERTTEEQDEEVEELQARIASLRGVIADFGRRAGVQQTVEDDKMDVGV